MRTGWAIATVAVAGALVPIVSDSDDTLPVVVAAADRGPTRTTTPVDGARIIGPPTVTLYVSNEATNGYAIGDDRNDGTTKAAPLLTINEAARRANRDQAGRGASGRPVGTRILINDGTYREFVDWRTGGRDFETGAYVGGVSFSTIGATVPVIFEAENTGRVRLDGTDTTLTTDGVTIDYSTDATGDDAWRSETYGGVAGWSHRWVDERGRPIELGFFPNPFGRYAEYGAIARRTELAHLDGRPLRQVLCRSELAPGTFYVSDSSMADEYRYPWPLTDRDGHVVDTVPDRPCSEARPDGRIHVVPFTSAPSDWDDATFSTTFRGARVRHDPWAGADRRPLRDDGSHFLFHIANKSNIVVRGLTFSGATSRIRGSSAAVRIDHSRDILFEDTVFEHNNWIGVAAYGIRNPSPGRPFEPKTQRLTFRRITGSHNGGHGITATRSRDVIVEDSAFEFNNWRGDQAGLHNWDPGNKFMWVHDLVVRRSRFANNASHGLWLDTNHVNSTVEHSVFENNRGHGLYLEASIGPITVRGNTFRDNGRFESYPGIEGYGVFATFTDHVLLDANTFIDNDIPLVIGGRTEHTHQPVSNSYDFQTGLSFADTADDPRGAHWQITRNTFTTGAGTYLLTLGIPLENFANYVPWAAENDWSRFID
ncbi:MAG: right-handed parallel beta-helix repeat-containing protein, partial [Actinomycetota bacterium]